MSERQPNVLLIVTDQQRGDCLGIEGHPVLETPWMDFLGRSGTHFRRAYAEYPVCAPARRTMMTGRASAPQSQPWDPPHTLPGELRAAGYQTEMIGKLHVGPPRKRYGFDHMLLADATRGQHNDYVDWLSRFGAAVPVDRWGMAHGATPNGWIGRASHLPETQTHAFWCATEAIAFLHRRDPFAPFFLNVSFIDPHPPFTPPAAAFERYDRQTLPPPQVGDWALRPSGPQKGGDPEVTKDDGLVFLDERQLHHWRAGYYGLINHVDYQVGRLLQYMRETGLLEETFVLFTSDHGEMLGDHHMIGKHRPFEPAARVPFLARPPAAWGFPRGAEVTAPVGLQDVMPTLLAAAGVPVPDTCTGRSVLPLMRGSDGRGEAAAWRSALHGECSRGYPPAGRSHYLVDGQSKYIWSTDSGREMFFDLERDPLELRDRAGDADAQSELRTWRRRLAAELRDHPDGLADGDRLIPRGGAGDRG